MRYFKLYFYIITNFIFLNVLQATIYQAETASLYKAVIETENSGYTGESYINFNNEPGSYLELKVSMADTGIQIIQIRFANGTSTPRPMGISLNGEVAAASAEFNSTDSWTNWDTLTVNATFKKGINILRLTSLGSEGGPNIDCFDISGEQGNSYSINITVTGPGTVSQNPEHSILFEGQEVILKAYPEINGRFTGWGGDISGTADSVTIVMDSSKTISACFEEINIEIPEPDFSMTGYASLPGEGYTTTTGGEGGKVIYINSLPDFVNWTVSREDNETPEIVMLQGKFESAATTEISIKHGRNISLLGDPDFGEGYAEFKNVSINIRDYPNVIVRNLKMHEVDYPNDDLTIDECHHVWIDHCEFYSKIGPGIGVDTYDGLLDIKKGSHNVTVSWCYFHDHMKTMLIGHSDNNGVQDKNLQVTIHHCRFSNTDGRNPSFRFGTCHYFNNYLENISDYGFAARNGAHARIENCHFHNVAIPIDTDKFDGHGFVCVSGCVYSGSCTEYSNQIYPPYDCEYWPTKITYPYQPEAANTVKESVTLYAGAGILKTVLTTSPTISATSVNLKIWPIPAREYLSGNFYTKNSEPVNILVYDLSGAIRFNQETLVSRSGINSFAIPANNLPTGSYFLKISGETFIQSEKFSVIK